MPAGSPGAAPGPSRLDVERFRSSSRRTIVIRRVSRPVLVLGSTQDPAVVAGERARSGGTVVTRRRSGGGAVLAAGGSVWVDAWVPAPDPLADTDVMRAAGWVGEWWARALGALGVQGAAVHRGRAACGPLSDLVCFAGLASGEVEVGGRKVVGVSQWRCRQGALFQCMAYLRWDVGPLLELLVVPEEWRASAPDATARVAVGVGEVCDAAHVGVVEDAVLAELPGDGWAVSVEEPG